MVRLALEEPQEILVVMQLDWLLVRRDIKLEQPLEQRYALGGEGYC